MVMPRSRSMSMESSTCSTISRSASPPVSWISRSASVDLPWSICATIEKLRMLSMAPDVMARLSIGRAAGPDSLRREATVVRDRLRGDRAAVAYDDHVPGRHRLPTGAVVIERLGDHHHVVAVLTVVERVR